MVAAMVAVTAAVRRSRKGSGSREIRTLGERNLEHRSQSWEGLGRRPIYAPRHARQQPAKGSAGKLGSGP